MRSAAVGIILGIVLVSALAGCGSSVVDQPSLVPSASPRANDPCAPIPTIDPVNPPDTLGLTGDPTLEAEFPAQIDGETVTDVAHRSVGYIARQRRQIPQGSTPIGSFIPT